MRASDKLAEAIQELVEESIGDCIDTDEIAETAAEKVSENLDLSSEIEEAVENKMEDFDFSSQIENALNDVLDDKVRECIIDHLDHITEQVETALKVRIEELVAEAVSKLTFNIVVQPVKQ